MSAPFRRWSARSTQRLITALSTRPAPYYAVRRTTGTFDDLCVRPDTEIVIEGFPRSANSTTVHGFLERQDRPVRVAHHKHHVAQLVRAARWRIPALALVRPPREAVVSLLALTEEARRRQGGHGGRTAHLTFDDLVVAWLAFYRTVLRHRDAIIVAAFDRATQDLTGVIESVNDRFGTTFASAEATRRPQPKLGWHARSNALRREIQDDLETALREAETTRPRLAERLRAADGLLHVLVKRD